MASRSTSSAAGKRAHKVKQPERIAEIRDTAMNTSNKTMAALVPVDKDLTEKQKLFVKYWVEGDNIPGAMNRAGYNEQPSYGYRMARMPNILAAKAKYHAAYAKANEMTKKKVMDMMLEAYDMSKLMAEPATMVSAAREVGRLCGFYEPTKVQINVTHGSQREMESLTDAELFAMIEQAKNLPEEPLEAAPDDFEDADDSSIGQIGL